MESRWHEDRQQARWLCVGLLFGLFYYVEAILFWGPEPRVPAPQLTPLFYWALFGAAVVWVVNRPIAGATPATLLESLQSWLIGATITAAVVGLAYLVIRRTHDLTLGHAVLLFAFAQAGLLIGALTFSPGWLAAGALWLLGGAAILWEPDGQDYVLGGVVAAGFMLIGAFRKRLIMPNRP